jgi:uncharacterized membrane protein (UPF0127 family)
VAKTLPVLSAAFLLLSACGPKATGEGDLNTTEITFPNGKTILAETMRQQVDQMRGMMFRDSLDKDRGMLFVHPSETNVPYWMYQVRIPLDIIWMDHQRRIVEISANTPACTSKSSRDCPGYGGHEKARYVLELAAGGAAIYGLKVGDRLDF